MQKKLNELQSKIVKCKKCTRLVNFRNKVAHEKTKRFAHENYWGKPITGFGDPNAKVVFVGLAPAAHGGNRTGRVFTGDKSAEFLFKCLFKIGYSNQPYSNNVKDGLKLNNAYLTTALKCVPPQDKPTSEELRTCFKFFHKEIEILSKMKVVVCLGRIAFDTCVKAFELNKKNYQFSHGKIQSIDKNFYLASSYHPSPRNVNTGRLNEEKMLKFLRDLKTLEITSN